MNFPTAVKTCLRKCVNTSGRASRSEFWYFSLFYTGLCICINVASYIIPAFHLLLTTLSLPSPNILLLGIFIYVVLLTYIITLLMFVFFSISVTIRRLHDLDKSGWFCLLWIIPLTGLGFRGLDWLHPLYFIPLIGWLYMLYLMCRKGTKGENRFGPPVVLNDIIDMLKERA